METATAVETTAAAMETTATVAAAPLGPGVHAGGTEGNCQ